MFIQPYSTFGSVKFGNNPYTTYSNLFEEGKLANESVTWERSTKQNLGFDLILFNKLSITSEFFEEKRDNILNDNTLLFVWLGADNPVGNIGKTKSHGYELEAKWNDELFKYMTGIVQHYGHKLLAINGMPDHVHVFFGMRPTQALSDLMQDVKGSSSKWINDKRLCAGRFSWQEGYGAFSYSKSDVQNVMNYVINQKNHHEKISFVDEYLQMLRENDVIFDDKYMFDPVGIDYSESDNQTI
jgi:REP element-mobilizing transposase RayT